MHFWQQGSNITQGSRNKIIMDDNLQRTITHLLSNCTRVAFLEEKTQVRRPANGGGGLLMHGGIESTLNIVDVSALSSSGGGNTMKNKKKMETQLSEMGDDGTMPTLLTVRVQCQSRDMGDMKVAVESPLTGEIIASLERKKRRGTLWLAGGETEIPVLLSDGSTFAIVKPSMTSGGETEIVAAGDEGLLSFKRWCPAWQAQTKWILFSFLCFFPTFGLGSCFGFYKAATSDTIHKTSKHENGKTIDLGHSIDSIISFEELSAWNEKLLIVCLGVFMQAAALTDPPVSQGNRI